MIPADDGLYAVGRRVRVHLSPDRICDEFPHHHAENDRTGKVLGISSGPIRSSHPYLVGLDDPVEWSIGPAGHPFVLRVRHFAVEELEPLE